MGKFWVDTLIVAERDLATFREIVSPEEIVKEWGPVEGIPFLFVFDVRVAAQERRNWRGKK